MKKFLIASLFFALPFAASAAPTTVESLISTSATTTSTFAGPVSIQTGSTGIYFLSNGNVGIGTSSPAYKLDVRGSGNFSGTLFASQNGQFVPGYYSVADLVLGSDLEDRRGFNQTGGSNIMLASSAKSSITALDQGNNLGQISYENLKWTIGEDIGFGPQSIYMPGKLGVGKSSPVYNLDVFSNATTTLRLDSSSSGIGSCIIMKDSDGSGYTYITANNGILSATTSPCN